MGDTTDDPDVLPVAYQPPRLRVTASYEPDNGRQPTGVEIEVFDDAPLTAAVIQQIVTGLAGVISGTASPSFGAAASPPASPPASTVARTVNATTFDLSTTGGVS